MSGQEDKDSKRRQPKRQRVVSKAVEMFTPGSFARKDQEERPTLPPLVSENSPTLSESSLLPLRSFMKYTVYEGWYGKQAEMANAQARSVPLSRIDLSLYAQDTNPMQFGEFIINPEEPPNFEKTKVFVPNLSNFKGKPLHEVMTYVLAKYKDTYYIPDVQYMKWCIENPDKIPAEMKLGNTYFFANSLMRDKEGRWSVPSGSWDNSSWERHAYWLSRSWNSSYQIVLLEKN